MERRPQLSKRRTTCRSERYADLRNFTAMSIRRSVEYSTNGFALTQRFTFRKWLQLRFDGDSTARRLFDQLVSEMTYTVSSGTLNSSIPYHTIPIRPTTTRPYADLCARAAVLRHKQAVWEAATICPASCKLTFDLLTLKAVSESRVTWATSVPILVFPGLSVLDLGPMCATDRRQTRIIA